MLRNSAEPEARSSVVIRRVSSHRCRDGPIPQRRSSISCRPPSVEEQWVAYHGAMENFWLAAAWSIIPTIGVSVVFFFVLRGILRFDRTERKVHARIEAEERAARGLPPRS